MNKQAKYALLVMLTAFSILPGCGKKNDAPAVATAGVASVSQIGSGQCASVSYNAAQTITFYGTLNGGSGIVGNLSAYGYGSQSFGGSNYYRNLNTGDSLNVYISGSTAYAVLSISANTASAIVNGQSYGSYNGGTAQICGISMNDGINAVAQSGSGYTGTMYGTNYLWGNNSYITYGPYYGNQPILF